jgi:hypothetical protein
VGIGLFLQNLWALCQKLICFDTFTQALLKMTATRQLPERNSGSCKELEPAGLFGFTVPELLWNN